MRIAPRLVIDDHRPSQSWADAIAELAACRLRIKEAGILRYFHINVAQSA